MERCRFCFVEKNRGSFKNIFDNEQTTPRLVKIVETLANLTIKENDPYSKMSCMNCFNMLILVYHYRETIRQTNQLFIENNNDRKFENDDCGGSIISDDDSNSLSNISLHLDYDTDDEKFQISNILSDDRDDSSNNIGCYKDSNILKNDSSIDEFPSVFDTDFNKHEPIIDIIDNKINNDNSDDTKESYHENSLELADFEDPKNKKCKRKFANKSVDLENCPNQKHQCSICNEEFSSKTDLSVHFKKHKNGKLFQCHICNTGNKFISKFHLKQHLPEHNGNILYCNVCNGQFSCKNGLLNHLNLVHTNEKKFKCHICDKIFISEWNLKQHLSKHSGQSHQCTICKRKFMNKMGLLRHSKQHINGKYFECHICDEKFPVKDAFKQHLITHSNKKYDQCNICDRKFTLKSMYKQHLLTHTVVRPYQCQFCDKGFSLKQNLKRHIICHNNRSYQCNKCDKSFIFAKYLRRHTTEHIHE